MVEDPATRENLRRRRPGYGGQPGRLPLAIHLSEVLYLRRVDPMTLVAIIVDNRNMQAPKLWWRDGLRGSEFHRQRHRVV